MKKESADLFLQAADHAQPLAARMRPRTLEEYVGQDHILGPGRLLRRAIRADQLSSIILSGPPGTGKTTLAMVIANSTSSSFQSINAVLGGVNELRTAIEEAKNQKTMYGKRTILFVDEVHRWNKAQQDALLPWVENGTVILVGATTENPWFEVNPALVSRSRVFQLVPLGPSDLDRIIDQTIADPLRGYGRYPIDLAPEARRHLVATANGDARTLLNALELAVESGPEGFPPEAGNIIRISLETAEDSIQTKAILYDPDGDYHFDTISAFIKSIRGSDPDAALYWLARMVKGGESPRFIFRRMLVSASEDIGLGDPGALTRVEAAAAAFERVGMPEGQYFLAQACLDLCLCPKSNSALGYFDALKAVEQEAGEVPDHLKDASRDKEALGHGKNYKYPHAWQEHWVAQQYLPHTLHGRVFYQPGLLGWEGGHAREVQERRSMQLAQADFVEDQEIRTSSPEDSSLSYFVRRHQKSRDPVLGDLKDRMLSLLSPLPQDRLAILGDDSAFLIPGMSIMIPNGFLLHFGSGPGVEKQIRLLQDLDHSRSSALPQTDWWRCIEWDEDISALGDLIPETGCGFRFLEKSPEKLGVINSLLGLQEKRGSTRSWVFAEVLSSKNPGLSQLLPEEFNDSALYRKVLAAEKRLRDERSMTEDFAHRLSSQDWSLCDSAECELKRSRIMQPSMIESWLEPRPGSLGYLLDQDLDPDEARSLKDLLFKNCLGKEIQRSAFFALLRVQPPD